MEMWLALAATTVLFGSTWQTVLEVRRQFRAMKFLKAHNALVREGLERIRRDVPTWRFLRRRRERRALNVSVFSTLSPEEATLTRDYDQSSTGWSLVTIGTLVATVAAWVQFVASI